MRGHARSEDAKPLAYLLLAAAALSWATNVILGRLAVGEASPMAMTLLRWLLAMPLLLFLARGSLRRDWATLRPHLGFLFVMGAVGIAAANWALYRGAHGTTAVNIGIIQGAAPALVMTGAFLAYRTRVGRLQIAGAAVTILGVALVVTGGDLLRLATLAIGQGDLWILLGATLFAGYTVGLQRCPRVEPISLFAVVAAAALLASAPLALIEAAFGHFQWPTARGWLIVALTALFASFLAQVLFIRGVALIGPGRASLFINLVPVFASILAIVLLGETFAMFQALALAVVLSGIWLAERGRA